MDNIWFASALWIGLALIASAMQAWIAVSVALLEIIIGAVAGNLVDMPLTPWVNYLAGFGAILLTFLAGAEIDVKVIRRNFGSTMAIGMVGFLAPYLGVLAWAHFVSGWPWPQAQIAGIALSTTSVAVVYAVMVETGFNDTEIGKIILAACFINDIGTVLALGLVFANYNFWLVGFAAATLVAMFLLPRVDAVALRPARFAGQRAADQVRAADPVRARRAREYRQERGRAAGLSDRHGACAGLSRRPRADAPDPGDRLHGADPVLFSEGGIAGAGRRSSSMQPA